MSRSSSDIATPAGCVCQDQHRRGYCTEPGCPYSNPLSRSSAEREQALEAINEMEGWVAILWQNAKRANRYSDDGVTQDGAGHIADAIERWLKPIRAALDVAQGKPEPAAWQYQLDNGRWANLPEDWRESENIPGKTYRPLYASPLSSTERASG